MPGTPVARLEPVIGTVRYARLLTEAARFRDRLGQRTIWNVNSTAVGGGVAEMLQVLVGYSAGLDIATRWQSPGLPTLAWWSDTTRPLSLAILAKASAV